MLDSLRNSKKTVGLRQSLKALEKNIVSKIILAKDADEKVTSDLEKQCKSNSIDIVYVESMKQLGRACGIDVNAAVVALLKDDLKNYGGEVN